MKYLYVNNLAYPYELQSLYVEKGEWPEEKGVDIDEVIFREYFYDTPPEGKYRCVGEDGLPAWADIPPPTREEQIASAETKKQQLINQANDYMNSRQWAGKAAIGRLKGEELAQYNLWLDYLDALELVDTSSAPDIEWPEEPDTM
ncbi:tail fiber assembly protein [Escherichia coli O25]|nr:tail fiber assembly protein [Escherichia coli O25]EFC5131295.1 tail fiber assembly protein [Escherichia coli]MHV59492.1 tail fiber assembly protein [Escherichia coli]